MIIPLGTDDWESPIEDISRIRLHNMYIAENPTSPDGKTRVSRPTLTTYITVGDGPVQGIWRQDGTINGDTFVVSAGVLYRVFSDATSVVIGSLPGTGYVDFTGTTNKVVLVRSGIAYATDGSSLTTVVMPDGVLVGSVASINGYVLLSVLNSNRFYWIVPGGTDPDALDFAAAERFPDPVISIDVVSDEIWFLGSSGPEVWQASGDADSPFIRIPARVYNEGCLTKDAVVAVTAGNDPALIWVTDTRTVVLSQGSPKRISNESVEELLKTATNIRAWGFRYNRHDFYVLTADEFTFVYDIQMGNWPRWDTYERPAWQAHLGCQNGAVAYAGDDLTGTIWQLIEGVSDNGLPVIREVAGGIQVTGARMSCKSVVARVNSGWSPVYGFFPQLELRWSDDQGVTFSNYRQLSLGDKGRYDTDVIFRSLGKIDRPGRIFEFRFSEFARFRLDYATVNDA